MNFKYILHFKAEERPALEKWTERLRKSFSGIVSRLSVRNTSPVMHLGEISAWTHHGISRKHTGEVRHFQRSRASWLGDSQMDDEADGWIDEGIGGIALGRGDYATD